MNSEKSFFFDLFHAILVGAAILLVSFTFLLDPGINKEGGYLAFPDVVYGRVKKPFVYRVLVPGVIRIIASALPESTHKWASGMFKYNFNHGNWEIEYALEYDIAVVLVCLSLLSFYVAVSYFCDCLFRGPPKFIPLVSLTALFGLPPFFKYWSYLYDFPALAFFTLGLALMVQRRWTWFLVLYLFSCLNKETTFLLSVVFFIYFRPATGRMNKNLFTRLLSTQLVMFALVKGGLYVAFRENPGSIAEFHLLDHNLQFITPYSLTTFLGWAFLFLLIARRWSQSHPFLKDALWILPILIVLTFFFGFLDELRDYYEAYPVVLMLLAPAVAEYLGMSITNREASPT
jgi:hypothetical protein